MNRRARVFLLFALKTGFSILLLWLVIKRVDFHLVVIQLQAANPRWLIGGIVCCPLVLLLAARRWQVLSQGLLTFWEAFRYTWIGLFFGSILPGMITGDVAKGVALAAKSPEARDERLAVSIFADKLVGLWTLLVLFFVSAADLLVIHPALVAAMHRFIVFGSAGLLAGLFAAVGILHPAGGRLGHRLVPRLPSRKLRDFGRQVLGCIGRYASEPWLVGQAVALSFAFHAVNCIAFWLVLRALAIPAGLPFAAVLYPMLSLLLAVPISVSGIGVRDVFLVTLFKAFGLNPASGVAFSWLMLGLSAPVIGVGGIIQLWEIFRGRKP